jgi:hypothetical protein
LKGIALNFHIWRLGNRILQRIMSMKRFTRIVAAGSFALMAAGPAVAQQPQVQATKTQAVRQPGITYGGLGQTPWFGDKTVREQFKFSDDQYNALNKAHGDAWTTYNTGVGRLEGTLTDAQRAQKMQELRASYHRSVDGSVDRVITDPQQRRRYNQLYLQYQGYTAFNDPTIQQQLKLTDDQRQKLAQYGQEWNQQMATYHEAYETDPIGTTKRYNEAVQKNGQRFNSVLNQQQQQTWRQMTGAPYNFTPGVYFQRVGGR